MDKSITTALLIVISMIMAVMLFNSAYPAIVQGGEAINSMAYQASERLKTSITIVHSAAELNGDGWWQDSNSNGFFEVFIWVKNTGSVSLIAPERMDVFFGPEGDFVRIPFEAEAGSVYPRWSWQLENGVSWSPTATMRLTLRFTTPLASGRYYLKVVLPDGLEASTFAGY